MPGCPLPLVSVGTRCAVASGPEPSRPSGSPTTSTSTRPVAIKVLADNWTGDLHIRQRFLEEGRFLRKVESPHVVTVYDAGELADERPYLVMAYADQGTLADRLELSPWSRRRPSRCIFQVGQGLTALHDRGVLHRDVKPANVLFRTVENAVARRSWRWSATSGSARRWTCRRG